MRLVVAGVLIFCMAACTPLGEPLHNKGFEHLVIAQFPENKELGRYSLGSDKTFSLSFIHSVSKTRVIDVYKIQNKQIIQTRELFETHGAGLPSRQDEPGGLSWEKTKNGFVLHMERPIPKLVVRTDKLYQNRLLLTSEIINLNQWDDQALLFFIEPENLFLNSCPITK